MSKLWWCATGAALLAASPWLPTRAPAPTSWLHMLLGPLAAPLARAQWVYTDAALREGRVDLALRRADTALALDPSDTSGWLFLAHHLAFERGSIARTPDASERALWIRAGLDLLERGRAWAKEPGALDLRRGAIWAALAEVDELRPPHITAEDARRRAAEAFEAAAQAGHLEPQYETHEHGPAVDR